MYQSSMLTNVNAKRINQSTSTTRTTKSYEEPEFSYNDVLYDEMSRNMKRHKRNTTNNSRNSNNANAATNFNTSSKISTFSNPMVGLSLGGTQSSNYMTSIGATNTSSNQLSKDDILDWVKRLIDEKTVVKGDADGDGKVDLNDLKVMVDRMFDDKVDIKMKNVDFDSDGKISLQDISKVIDIILEKGEPDDPVEPDPPPKEILKGDANGDGKVNYKDSDLTRKRLSNQNINIDIETADIDNDGEITISDFSEINHLTKKYEDKFQTIRGDSNGDGVVNEKDYTNVKDFINNVNSSDDFVMKNSDINDDGRIDSNDLQGMRDIMAGINVNYRKATLRGDVDGDGKVTKADAQLISDYTNRKAISNNFYINNADFNNDGKIDSKDVEAIEDTLKPKHKINYSTGGHLGDIDGNGSIEIKDAVLLNNYINDKVSSDKEIFINNTDVNRDGKVDIDDVNAIPDLLRNVRSAERLVPVYTNGQQNGDFIKAGDSVIVLEQQGDSIKIQYSISNGEEKIGWVHESIFEPEKKPSITYPYDGQYSGNAMWTYTDENLTHHKGNDVVTSGQIITILSETDNTWHIRYANVKGEVIERYLSKNSPASYQQWTAKALVYKEAYDDNGQRNGNEAVFQNDIVTVLNESINGYQVEYPTSNGKTKIRWITKTDIVPYEKPDNPPLQDMHISDEGIALVKRWEADNIYKYLTAYQNPGEEYLTIGYGHYGADVKPGMKITVAQAEAYLRQDLLNAERAVKKYCAHLNLNQHQFDALVSFTFNLNVKNLNKLLHGENGDEVRPLEELPEHMVWYRKDGTGNVSQGLINRRNAEVELFNKPI